MARLGPGAFDDWKESFLVFRTWSNQAQPVELGFVRSILLSCLALCKEVWELHVAAGVSNRNSCPS